MGGFPDSEEIPLARPEIGAREEELALDVLRSGRLSLGPMGERFEREFATWLGVEDALAVSSGTAALHLGVRALEWGPGDEVLTSPFSFVASANCLLYEGARPVFCDVDPETLNLDPAAAEAAVGERATGILPVHIFGYPAAMPTLEAIAARRGLGILEDACEALGAVDSEGQMVGARGNLATFAFYANKQLTTGEGGMIVPTEHRRRAPGCAPSAIRAAPPTWAGSTTADSASTTDSPTSPRRSASLSSSDLTRCSRIARGSPRSTQSGLAEHRGPAGRRAPGAAQSGAAGSSTPSSCPPTWTATRRSPASPSGVSPARPTCLVSTSFPTCASSATGRASSRSPKRLRRALWRFRSSRP